MKKLFYYLLILGLSFSIVSCDKDDNKDSSYSSMIVGTWQLDKMWEEGDGTTEWDKDDEEVPYVIFQKNGTGKFQEYDSYEDETYEDKFTWSITDNQLNIKYNDENEYFSSETTINVLTDNELVLEYYSDTNDEHWKEYYVRVK